MSILIERKFISYISSTLDKFKWITPNQVANFRCNICGDSESSTNKARGYIYAIGVSDMFCYKCQNCGASMSFKKYIKQYFPHYSKELRLDEFQFSRSSNSAVSKPVAVKDVGSIINKTKVRLEACNKLLTCLSDLPSDHLAVKYCTSRQLPESMMSSLYYTPDYKAWINQYVPNDDRRYPSDARLVMLMKDKDGTIFGAQGRTLSNSSNRYITVKFDESRPKVFGLDAIDISLPIFVLEGIIDSLFIPNAIAICGGDVSQSIRATGVTDFSKFIVALDNEPRSIDTVRRMESAISLGCNICFWDVDSSLKDVNDMIKSGMKRSDVLRSIERNIFKGHKALAKLKHWKKV